MVAQRDLGVMPDGAAAIAKQWRRAEARCRAGRGSDRAYGLFTHWRVTDAGDRTSLERPGSRRPPPTRGASSAGYQGITPPARAGHGMAIRAVATPPPHGGDADGLRDLPGQQADRGAGKRR